MYVDQVLAEGDVQPISGSPFVISSGFSTQQTIRNLRSGTNYHVRVQGENGNGRGSKSNLHCAATEDAAPDQVTQLESDPKAKTHNSISISWQEGEWNGGLDVTSYGVSW